MGAGTNIQRRLVALHHLDAPWRPRDIEQREGRILRQGNGNREVQIFRYVTEGSFDAYMWQTLETKARFIQQVMRGETTVRAAEDLEGGALTYAEIKAIASGNPAVVEKIKIDTEVRKLDQLRAVHANQQRHIRWEIRDLPRQITEAKHHLAQIEADIATRNANDFDEFSMKAGNRVFSGKGAREEAAKALTFAILSWRDDQTMQPRGAFRGFEILSRGKSGGLGIRTQPKSAQAGRPDHRCHPLDQCLESVREAAGAGNAGRVAAAFGNLQCDARAPGIGSERDQAIHRRRLA